MIPNRLELTAIDGALLDFTVFTLGKNSVNVQEGEIINKGKYLMNPQAFLWMLDKRIKSTYEGKTIQKNVWIPVNGNGDTESVIWKNYLQFQKSYSQK